MINQVAIELVDPLIHNAKGKPGSAQVVIYMGTPPDVGTWIHHRGDAGDAKPEAEGSQKPSAVRHGGYVVRTRVLALDPELGVVWTCRAYWATSVTCVDCDAGIRAGDRWMEQCPICGNGPSCGACERWHFRPYTHPDAKAAG